MAITPEDIETVERELQRNREAVAKGETGVPISIGRSSPKQIPSRIFSARRINGKDVNLVVIPVELAPSRGLETYARKLRIEQTRPDHGTQCRVVTFNPPVLITETGIFLSVLPGRDKQRFGTSALQLLNPWLVFSGRLSDRRILKAFGASFEKV